MYRTYDDGAGIHCKGIEGSSRLNRMRSLANRAAETTMWAEARYFVKSEIRSGGNDQIVVIHHASVVEFDTIQFGQYSFGTS